MRQKILRYEERNVKKSKIIKNVGYEEVEKSFMANILNILGHNDWLRMHGDPQLYYESSSSNIERHGTLAQR